METEMTQIKQQKPQLSNRTTNTPLRLSSEIVMDSSSSDTVRNNIWMREMEKQFETKPNLLLEKAGKTSCCVFRIPPTTLQIEQKPFHPLIASIGPYHHGLDRYQLIEQHKMRFVRSLLIRTNLLWKNLELCSQFILTSEDTIREFYSEDTSRFASREFVEMIIRDGCFIIELILQALNLVPRNSDDPIFSMDWIIPSLMQDFIKLENQIPFFVLEKLYKIAVPEGTEGQGLANLVLKFYSSFPRGSPASSPRSLTRTFDINHILDLVRESFRPLNGAEQSNSPPQVIQTVNKLDQGGIKFELRRRLGISFLEMKFQDGALKIPELKLDSFMICLILNCVAFEQCYGHTEKFMTNYVVFMDCLIGYPSDVGLLCNHKIIKNCYYDLDEDIAAFLGELGEMSDWN